MKRALQAILAISLFGMMFSGTLAYREIFAKTVAVSPSPGAHGTILGYPACVYGLVMYALVAVVAGVGLHAGRIAEGGRRRERSVGDASYAPRG